MLAGVEMGTTLANNDVARNDLLVRELLYTESFAGGTARPTTTTAHTLGCRTDLTIHCCRVIRCANPRAKGWTHGSVRVLIAVLWR